MEYFIVLTRTPLGSRPLPHLLKDGGFLSESCSDATVAEQQNRRIVYDMVHYTTQVQENERWK